MTYLPLTGWEGPVEPWHPGTEPRPGLAQAWQADGAPYVRVTGVNVLRISDVIAAEVLARLHERGITPGPILINIPRQCIEILVPLGSAATWRPTQHTVLPVHALMRCPAPDVTQASGRWAMGRTWTRPPGTYPAITGTSVLAEAVAEVLDRDRAARRRRIEGWAGDQPVPAPREDQP